MICSLVANWQTPFERCVEDGLKIAQAVRLIDQSEQEHTSRESKSEFKNHFCFLFGKTSINSHKREARCDQQRSPIGNKKEREKIFCSESAAVQQKFASSSEKSSERQANAETSKRSRLAWRPPDGAEDRRTTLFGWRSLSTN